MASNFIQQLTVYADVKAAAHLDVIQSCAKRLCPANTCVIPLASLNRPPATASASVSTPPSSALSSSSLQFMRLWEKEREDTTRVVRNTVLFSNQLECFITSGQSLTSGEVAYALYRRQMPVLALAAEENGAPTSEVHERGKRGNGSGASMAAAPPTAVQKFLYHERTPSLSVEDAIKEFFTFPESMGAMLAVENGDCTDSTTLATDPAASASSLRFRNVCEALQQLHGTPSFHHNEGRFIFFASDGYPLTQPPAFCSRDDTRSGDVAGNVLPRPTPAFQHLLQTLASANAEGGFCDLLQQSPQLYGALASFNRYENRGLIRYLMQRGCWPVVFNHTAPTAAELARVLREAPPPSPGSDSSAEGDTHTATAEAFQRHLASLVRFEGHWMDLATPCYRVYLSAAGKSGADEATPSSVVASLPVPWLAYMNKTAGKRGTCIQEPNGGICDILSVDPTATTQSVAKRVSELLLAEVRGRNTERRVSSDDDVKKNIRAATIATKAGGAGASCACP